MDILVKDIYNSYSFPQITKTIIKKKSKKIKKKEEKDKENKLLKTIIRFKNNIFFKKFLQKKQ